MIQPSKKPGRNKTRGAHSIRINISLPPVLAARAPELLSRYGFTGLSDYYQSRMRKDLGLELVA